MAGDSTIEKRLQLFRQKFNDLQEKICRMNETLDALKYKVWFYETAEKAGSVDVHENLKNVPPEMSEICSRMKHVDRFTDRNLLK